MKYRIGTPSSTLAGTMSAVALEACIFQNPEQRNLASDV